MLISIDTAPKFFYHASAQIDEVLRKDAAQVRYQTKGSDDPQWLTLSITHADKKRFFPQGFITDIATIALMDKRTKQGKEWVKSCELLEENYNAQVVAYLLQSGQIQSSKDVVFLSTEIMPSAKKPKE